MIVPRRILLAAVLAGLAACGARPSGTDAAGSAPPPSARTPESAGSMPEAAVQHTPSADGVSIAWRQYGHGEPAIVLIHGWALDSSIWRAQLGTLSARYSIITLDLAGQGSSGTERPHWTIALFARDVAAVAAKLPNAHIILVGQGLGGPVALAATPFIGARVQGVIGVETFRTLGAGPLLPSQLEHALAPFQADFAGALRQYVSGTLFHSKADPTLVHAVTELMSHTAPERAMATLTELNRFDYGPALAAVKVPIVAIDSDLSGAVDATRLDRVAPQLRLIILPGDDDFPMLDDAQRFNTTLMQAVDSLATR